MTSGGGSGSRGGTPEKAGTNPRAPLQTSCGHMRLRQVLRHIGQAESGQRRIEHLGSAVEDELPIDSHLQFVVVLLELPGVQPTIGRQAQIDARA